MQPFLIKGIIGLLASGLVAVAAKDRPEEVDLELVVVTGSFVRQGGAQDIRHFRSIAEDVGMPRPESLTVEGLFGEHDLSVGDPRECKQLFCLATESMQAHLETRRDDLLLIALGFATNIDPAKWQRRPLNLVAVVDKSGSMNGTPLARVRSSLQRIVKQMKDEDQIAVVLYGDSSHVYLAPTPIKENRSKIHAAIDAIKSAGSTNMEAGLKVGYETALSESSSFKGVTRLMLFTDEQPNVGRVDAQSFMAMATEASKQGVGLTTIGVGVQFDAALASRVSAVRGGNLFFVSSDADVEDVFGSEFDTMVSELAHDVTMRMRPIAGYEISGVFGVPDQMMRQAAIGEVTIVVPTAFLSTKGGGVFVTLTKSQDRAHLPALPVDGSAALLEVELSYVAAETGLVGKDQVVVMQPQRQPSDNVKLGHALIDEYLVLQEATTAFHMRNDAKSAHRLLIGLASRLAAISNGDLDKEKKLVNDMTERAAAYAGYAGEAPRSMRHLAIVGKWEVVSLQGIADLKIGDRVEMSPDREMTIYRKKHQYRDDSEIESYQVNERQLYLEDSGVVFDYKVDQRLLTLTVKGTLSSAQPRIVLRRSAS